MISQLKNYRLWLWLQAGALLWGNYVGWSTIYREVQHYCTVESRGLEALLSFSGTATTNPLLTPCFWGTLVFSAALIWTLRIIFTSAFEQQVSELKRLWFLLLAGTLFALVNNIPLFYNYITKPETAGNTCSTDKFLTNPFLSSCFLGFSAFLLASVMAYFAKRYLGDEFSRDKTSHKR